MLVIHTQFNLYYFWEKRWFFLAMALGAFMLTLPLPEGLSRDGMIVLTMSVVATILFVTEPVPLPTEETAINHEARDAGIGSG